MQQGGNPPGKFWNGKEYVQHKGTGTYNDGVYFAQGGPAYYPPKQQPGYRKVNNYLDDGGNITELQNGGYIPPSINAQPNILQRTDGVYHMGTGGYIPASINAQPHILQRDSGVYHMANGGYSDIYTARPGPPIRENGGYWHPYSYIEDGGNITELQYGGSADSDGDADMMKKGGIHINPANKGKFNALKKRTGKSTEELTHSSNPLIRKRAVFAQNAAKWHHEEGGPVYADGGTVNQWDLPTTGQGTRDYGQMYGVGDYGLFNKVPGNEGWEGFGDPSKNVTNMNTQGYVPNGTGYGAPTKRLNMENSGDPIGDIRKEYMRYGGRPNPFHPLAYMADGGVNPYTPSQNVFEPQQVPVAPQMDNPDPNAQERQQKYPGGTVPPVSPQYATNDQPVDSSNFAPTAYGDADAQAQYNQQQGPNGWQKAAMWGKGFGNVLGAGLATAAYFTNKKNEKDMAGYNRSLGMSDKIGTFQSPGSKGDYNQQGNFRPDRKVPTNPGYYSPARQYGGPAQQYANGSIHELPEEHIKELIRKGFKVEYI